MLGLQNSGDRRRSLRKRINSFIKFRVTDLSGPTPLMVEKRAEVLDLNEFGFGIRTDFPLQKGHIITITEKDNISDMPDYGIVLWSKQDGGFFRAGLIYKSINNQRR